MALSRNLPSPTKGTREIVRSKQNFLENLANYIPLGTLTYDCGTFGGDQIPRNQYEEIGCLPPGLDRHRGAHALSNLIGFQWVRVFLLAVNGKYWIRAYILPDDVGRRYLQRDDKLARRSLMELMTVLDRSVEAWHGRDSKAEGYFAPLNPEGLSEEESLFYIFNTLPSPTTTNMTVSCPYSDHAIRNVLDNSIMAGLVTGLYPYQKRAVATMIRREVEPARTLDPRLQTLYGPDGRPFYYDLEAGDLLKDKREYEEVCGGILGESMGLGKTLICLALILATRGHWPNFPPEYMTHPCPTRPKVASLLEMAAIATTQNGIPWRSYFQDMSAAGEEFETCRRLLEKNAPSYFIPSPVHRTIRRPSTTTPGRTIRLCTATLVIVPQNLLSQWKGEVALHIEASGLKVLYLDAKGEIKMPDVEDMLQYDVILMPRHRLEREMIPPESSKFSRKEAAEYISPLRDLHFLRVIMDEGHEFASYGSRNKCYWSLQELRVDRKWIVSGTPSDGLVGIEVETSAYGTTDLDVANSSGSPNKSALQKRRLDFANLREKGDLEKLGGIVVGYLKLRPWANSKEDDPASWSKYIMPFDDGRRKSRSMRSLLESLVVRHRIEDIEKDLHLPPLYNRVVYLRPTWHDKLSINLFILSLVANAVTSERVDEDYMFHTKNRHNLHQLINNLRQSGFYWTSFNPEEVTKTLKISREYLDKHNTPESSCSASDRQLLEHSIQLGETVLASEAWKAFALIHEMGMFVENFPSSAAAAWSLVPPKDHEPLLMGASQLIKSQQWVDSQFLVNNVSKSLSDLGTSTMRNVWTEASRQATEANASHAVSNPDESPSKKGAKSNKSRSTVPALTDKHTISRVKKALSPGNTKRRRSNEQSENLTAPKTPEKQTPSLKSILKSSTDSGELSISTSSPPVSTHLVGTASAKLSYLLDRVVTLHNYEKILIFYEGDQIAWYIAQGLDLLSIRYLIYTPKLTQARQNAYIATFNQTSTFRVLLMDIQQAAHGLHIASASRVFFVNPVWQPSVEAQAVKRAHRIGQTKPVYVETLILRDTLEDYMLRRRKEMTTKEHQKAEKSLLDDQLMSDIIKRADFVPFTDDERQDAARQMAKLQLPQQIFGRINRPVEDDDDPDADLIFLEDISSSSKKNNRKRKAASDHSPTRIGFSTPHRSIVEEVERSTAQTSAKESPDRLELEDLNYNYNGLHEFNGVAYRMGQHRYQNPYAESLFSQRLYADPILEPVLFRDGSSSNPSLPPTRASSKTSEQEMLLEIGKTLSLTGRCERGQNRLVMGNDDDKLPSLSHQNFYGLEAGSRAQQDKVVVETNSPPLPTSPGDVPAPTSTVRAETKHSLEPAQKQKQRVRFAED